MPEKKNSGWPYKKLAHYTVFLHLTLAREVETNSDLPQPAGQIWLEADSNAWFEPILQLSH